MRITEDDTAMLAMWDARMSTASIATIMGRSEASVDRRLAELRGARRSAAKADPVEAPAAEAAPAPAVEASNLQSVQIARPPAPAPVRTVEGRRIGAGMMLLAAGLVSLREAMEAGATIRKPAAPAPVRRSAAPRAAVVTPRDNTPPAAGGPAPETAQAVKRRFTAAEDDVVRRCWRDHPGHAASAAATMLDRPISSIRWRAHMLGLRQDGAPRVDAPPMLRLRKPGAGRAAAPRRPVATRIRPLTPRVLRWCGHFHVADWAVDEIADLFDLDVEELGRALGGGAVATAEAARP